MRWLAIVLVLAGLAASGCTDDRRPVEEPVQTSPPPPKRAPKPKHDPKQDDDAGFSGGDAADGAAADNAAEPEFYAPADAPAAAPVPDDPKKPSGGIISSGNKAKPGSECAKIKNTKARKDCLARARKAQQN